MQKTSLKKILSILLAIVMLATTCAISFGVSAEETEDQTAIEALAAFINDNADIVTFFNTAANYTQQNMANKANTRNYRVYTTDSYDTYLKVIEAYNLFYAASMEIMDGTDYQYNATISSTGTFSAWNTFTLNAAIIAALQEVDSDIDTTIVNPICLGSNGTTYNPSQNANQNTNATNTTVSYVGSIITTTDFEGYSESLTSTGVDYSMAYSIDFNATIYTENGYYIRYFADESAITCDPITSTSDVNSLVSSVDTSTTGLYPVILTAITAASYAGSCGDNAYYSYDSSTGTLTISGSGELSVTSVATQPWSGFGMTSVVVEEGITSLGQYTFRECSKIKSISLPSTLEGVIGAHTFYGCTSLTSLAIPEGITELSSGSIRACTSLQFVYLPSTMETINVNAFYNSYSTSITPVIYYSGTETEYNAIDDSAISTTYDKWYINATVNYNFEPTGEFVEEYSQPTCVDDGSALYTCTTTGLNYIETIAATGSHTYSIEGLTTEDPNYVVGSCTTNGYWTDVECELCDTTATVENPDSTIDHTFITDNLSTEDDNYTAPDCTTDGYWTVTCEDCSATTKVSNDNTALGHTFTTVYVHYEATCYTTGYQTQYCDVCGKDEVDVREVIPATGEHTYGDYVVTTPATCSATGIATATCEVCQAATDTITVDIDLNNHTYVDGVCTGCDAVEPEESETPEVEEEEVEVSFIDKMMAWINELLAAFVALFSF